MTEARAETDFRNDYVFLFEIRVEMRIGFFAYSLSGIGPRTRARTLIDALADRTDHEIVVVTGPDEDYTHEQVEIHRDIRLTPTGFLKTARRTRNYFHDVNVVHVPVNMKQVAFVRAIYDGPLVAGAGIQHGLFYRTFGKYADIDKIIETHEYVSYLWWKAGFDSTHIYPAIDEEQFYPFASDRAERIRGELGVPDGNRVVLFVGKLNEFKGAHIFDRVVRELDRSEDVTPIVVGDGPLRSRFEDRDDLLYEGFVHNENLPEYYNVADVTVVPSEYESFSLVSLESIVCGTPVVTTTSEEYTMARLFKDRGTYVWASDRSASAVSQEVSRLLHDEDTYARQVQRGFETIEEMGLTISNMIDEYVEVYTEACN